MAKLYVEMEQSPGVVQELLTDDIRGIFFGVPI